MATTTPTLLKPKQKHLHTYLQTKAAGDIVTKEELLAKTTWTPSSFATYQSKHYIDPFLAKHAPGRYRVLKNGSDVSEADIAKAFTQVRPELFVPCEGIQLRTATGAYTLKARLGNGAVAHVWSCTLETSGKAMAAKIMLPRQDLLDPNVIPDVRRRFAREAKHGQRLAHPNVVVYADSGDIEEHPFLIMELADTTLAAVLESSALTVPESLMVMQHCLKGLAYLHGEGCIHRDIKPPNILKFGDRYVLGDLGIVKWSDMNPAFTSAGTMTLESVKLGSWHYMPPEQRRMAHEVTTASDVYALGLSWYEMLTRKTPDPADVAAKNYPKATDVAIVEETIRRMLSYLPSDRPTLDVLQTLVNGLL